VLASPSVAAAATDGRSTFVWGGGSTPIPIRIVATTKLFPTITSQTRFIVADYDTASAFLNEVTPGIAPPTEAWFFNTQSPTFAAKLQKLPFRLSGLVSEQQNQQALLEDPLASGTRSLLLATTIIAALLGLLGLLVAIRAMLRDESSILAEYEALGIRPSVLARSTATRLTALSLVGIAAGIGGGLLAVRLVGSLVAVTAGGGVPLPPIQATISWPSMAVLLAVVAAAAIAAALILARNAFARPVAQRLRA
jgi:ABC-type antimicrobial peptide transport system permease subunit